MTEKTFLHPSKVLFDNPVAPPILPIVEHFAPPSPNPTWEEQMKFLRKAVNMVEKNGWEKLVDINADCEDGAPWDDRLDGVEMFSDFIISEANVFGNIGVRVNDPTQGHWKEMLEILISRAGQKVKFITFPKTRGLKDVQQMVGFVKEMCEFYKLERQIPLHLLVETIQTLAELPEIARYNLALLTAGASPFTPYFTVFDHGIMDLVSDYLGSIPNQAMRTCVPSCNPGDLLAADQYHHGVVMYGKARMSFFAHYAGCVAADNVTQILDKNVPVTGSQAYEDAFRSRQTLAMRRKWSIFPDQPAQIIEAMKPDLSRIPEAADIMLRAQEVNYKPISVDGNMQDRASYRFFWNLLKEAHALGFDIPEKALERFFTG